MAQTTYWQTVGGRMAQLANWPHADASIHGLATELIPEMCRLPYDYLFRDDPVAMAECTLLMQEYFNLDVIYANMDVYNFEGEAMGAKLNYYPKNCPDFDRSEPFVSGWDDLGRIRFTGLDAGRIPYLIEYSKAYKTYTGMDTFPQLSAPWTIACNLVGTEEMILATVDDPDFVHEILRRIVDDYHLPLYAEVKKLFPGVNSAFLPDAFASAPMVTMDIVDEFIKPAMEHEREELGKLGIFAGYTSYFGYTKLPESMQRAYIDFIVWGNTFFMALDPDLATDGTRRCRDIATELGVNLVAGIDGPFLKFAPESEIIERVKETMLTGKDGPTPLILLFSCINPAIDLQKMRTVSYAARFYGSEGVTEEDEFVPPEPLGFEEFLRAKMADNREGYTFAWLGQSGYSHLADE